MAEPTWDEYKKWKEDVFGSEYMIWHDGLDLDAVTRLEGADRQRATQMLLVGLRDGDAHAASSLAAMGDSSVLATLHAQLSASSGDDKVMYADAIYALSPAEADAMAGELVQVLHGDEGHWSPQMSAAISLRKYGDAASEEALLKAVEEHREYLVRYHSCDSLLQRWKATTARPGSWTDQYAGVFKLICDPPEGEKRGDAERRRAVVAMLKKIRDKKKAG